MAVARGVRGSAGLYVGIVLFPNRRSLVDGSMLAKGRFNTRGRFVVRIGLGIEAQKVLCLSPRTRGSVAAGTGV